MDATELPADTRFAWPCARDVLLAWARGVRDPRPDATGRVWTGRSPAGTVSTITLPPAVLPDDLPPSDPRTFAAALRTRLGRELVLLIQAGAFAAALFVDDELLVHRARRRYVIRGRGRAQPTHLDRRGKSRYGSRLRLQNARRLVDDLRDCLAGWVAAHGEPERVHLSCPVRLWADFASARPPLPLGATTPRRVPFHVQRPTFAELTRVRFLLTHGELRTER